MHTHGAAPPQERDGKKPEKEKGCAEKEKSDAAKPPPFLEDVRVFFREQGYRELEALRFFHHYSATGWLLGQGPVRNWQAAAHKWVLNGFNGKQASDHAVHQGNPAAAPGATGAGERKDYSEPL